ncbi:exported protein [Staphylococcus aureus]|nr:exported protein [Staphylococcus aureus]
MTVKNLFLGFVAVILTVCLIGLLILATNEDALAKVHKTINTLNAINVSTEDTYKKKMDILNIHTAKASEVNENVKKQNHFKHRVNANNQILLTNKSSKLLLIVMQISLSMIIMV